jgi:two-component system chemotaxis response regulator CheY
MGTILVVDDSAVVRRTVGLILDRGGHQVSYATNGEEGLAAVETLRPDLILSDLEMPVMDGIAFVRRLHADAATQAIPVIMLTASGEAEHERTASTIGIQGFATKPVRSTDLLELIDRTLGGP